MNPKLQLLLVALGFGVVGSATTYVGFRMAMPDPTAQAERLQDTAARAPARPGRAARSARGATRGQGMGGHGPSTRGGRGPGAAPGRGWAALADELDMTAEQRQAWVHMMQTVRSSCGSAGLQGAGVALDLLGAVTTDPTVDAQVLHGQLDARMEDQRKAAHCVLTEFLTFQATLTPEQRTAVAARVGQLEERRQTWLDGWSQ